MGKVTAKIIGWTDEQDAELVRLAGTMPAPDLAKKIKRNFRQMQVQASKLGISLAYRRTYTQWTAEEDRKLVRFWEDKLTPEDVVEIAETTGIYEVTRDELTHEHVATWLDKSRPAVRGRLAKFKKEGKIA
ncbi:hypothetical protein sortregn_11 [Escherichia phage sortregn]|uniref:Uncharacterized protein n=1 Tax=Salmonella phage Lumpael TaxID=2488859 RepID=A0A3G8F314_9CAUD|nr:hypothetical protein HOU68_gp27 [Salmonella phage Lumpael]AZF88774.1 hypothetical protein [Salmonella phage Lumpael]QHR68033.1 hypothetical protein sortregn_11 [Escherichia phage sortregn]